MTIEIKVNINAPGLEGAIQLLAQAFANHNLQVNVEGGEAEQPKQEAPQQVPQAPIQQQAPVQQVPTGQQGVPVQQPQAPVQNQAPIQQPQQPQGVPTNAPEYTMEQIAVAATQLVDAGNREGLINLLQSFGVQALTALPKEQYGAFATKLRELGAKL